MRKFLTYAFTDGKTPLSGQELTRRFTDVDGRLHVLEELRVSWEEAVAVVQNHGLERINTVLQPVLDQTQALISQVEQDISAIGDQWQAILDAWAAMQEVIDGLNTDVAALEAQATSLNQAVLDARDYAVVQDGLRPIYPNWYANPDTYSPENVQITSGGVSWGVTRLPEGVQTRIWAQVVLDPAYDYQIEISFRMTTSEANNLGLVFNAGGLGDGEHPAIGFTAMAASEACTTTSTINRQSYTFTGEIDGTALSEGDITLLAFGRNAHWSSDSHQGHMDIFYVRLLPKIRS